MNFLMVQYVKLYEFYLFVRLHLNPHLYEKHLQAHTLFKNTLPK